MTAVSIGSVQKIFVAALVVFAFLVPGTAHALSFRQRQEKATNCAAAKTLVRIDTRICPANRRRPALPIRRACCANLRGKVKCKAYGKCPARSPS